MALRRSAVRSRLAPPRRQNPRPGNGAGGFSFWRKGAARAACAVQKVAVESAWLPNLEYDGIWFFGLLTYAKAADLRSDKNSRNTAEPVESPGEGRATILLIEDDPLLREMMLPALQRAGFAVLVAENGKVGLQIARGQKVDLVVTDIFMPETDGIETIRKLRDQAPTLPILAISGRKANRMSDILAMSVRLGATETISKPFLPSELIAAVERLARAATLPPI
jgi:CheY-like chemotaxis protein